MTFTEGRRTMKHGYAFLSYARATDVDISQFRHFRKLEKTAFCNTRSQGTKFRFWLRAVIEVDEILV